MSKPFNIHDWQAKQRQQRLTEAGRDTPGGNPEYFYDDDSLIGKLKKYPDYIKKLNAKNAKKEHHEGGPLADKLKGMSANELMDFIESKSKLRYDELEGMLEDWWDLDENITGGGATFSDGNSMGHFGDATKKKIK